MFVIKKNNLNDVVILVFGEAIGAEGLAGALQTVQVALVLIGVAMDGARNEEAGLQQRPQP